MSELTSYSELAKELALTVGKKLNQITQAKEDLEISHKDTVDLVTKWDLWSEKTISEGILSQFPSHHIIGEESTDLSSIQATLNDGVHWIIDPIDGTTNFSNRLPHYAVSIGVLVNGMLSVGVVYDPSKDEMFHAVKGNGAFLNDEKIKVSKKSKLINSLVATGFSYDRAQTWGEDVGMFSEVLIKCRDIRRWGAASLDVCYVACGRFDAYLEAEIKLWDIAGGHVVLTEAGGTGQSFKERIGSKLILPKDYCCGSGESFDELLKIIQGPKGD